MTSAKLLWAGLNLEEGDLPAAWITRGFYPITMVRAMAIVWLFAGLRQDEIRRLRVGCIRVGPASTPGAEAVCLLDVPVNKTTTAFTKPVDRIVGEAVKAWELERRHNYRDSTRRPANSCISSSRSAARASRPVT
jgi:integrase